MYHIIGGNGKEYGPVDEETLHQWLRQGRANHNTRARRSDSETWSTVGQLIKEAASSSLAKDTSKPAGPGGSTADNGAINAQKEQEGAIHPGSIKIGKSLDEGFALLLGNAPATIGGTLFFLSVHLAFSAIGMIPLIGIPMMIGHTLLFGPLWAGVSLYFIRINRGRTHQIEDLFAGFGRRFIQVMFCWILQLLAIGLVSLTGLIWGARLLAGFDMNTLDDPAFLTELMAANLIILTPIGILATLWTWSIPLVVDKKLDAIEALKLSTRVGMHQFVPLSILITLASLIGAAGLALCCVGVVFTLPILMGSLTVAYEQTFPETENKAEAEGG